MKVTVVGLPQARKVWTDAVLCLVVGFGLPTVAFWSRVRLVGLPWLTVGILVVLCCGLHLWPLREAARWKGARQRIEPIVLRHMGWSGGSDVILHYTPAGLYYLAPDREQLGAVELFVSDVLGAVTAGWCEIPIGKDPARMGLAELQGLPRRDALAAIERHSESPLRWRLQGKPGIPLQVRGPTLEDTIAYVGEILRTPDAIAWLQTEAPKAAR